jgi:glycosyltransferase involved in cell wall biosynthesis
MSGGRQLNPPVDNRAGRVCIVIPAWNEEAPLSVLLQSLPVRVLGREVSTIVVSDGSTDQTEEVAGAAGATVISISGNRG